MANTQTTYAAEVNYLASLTSADADKLAQHRNPKLRDHVAGILAEMAKRHEHGEWVKGKDAQDCDDILYYASAAEIRRALHAE